jgi:hypothetical protein
MLFGTTIWLITSPKFALNSLYKILVLKTKQDEKSPLGSFIAKDLTLSKLESLFCVSISSCLLQNEKVFSGFLISIASLSIPKPVENQIVIQNSNELTFSNYLGEKSTELTECPCSAVQTRKQRAKN